MSGTNRLMLGAVLSSILALEGGARALTVEAPSLGATFDGRQGAPGIEKELERALGEARSVSGRIEEGAANAATYGNLIVSVSPRQDFILWDPYDRLLRLRLTTASPNPACRSAVPVLRYGDSFRQAVWGGEYQLFVEPGPRVLVAGYAASCDPADVASEKGCVYRFNIDCDHVVEFIDSQGRVVQSWRRSSPDPGNPVAGFMILGPMRAPGSEPPLGEGQIVPVRP